jgi:hypothetical protein
MSVSTVSKVSVRRVPNVRAYRGLLFSVLASCGLCAEVGPHTAVASAVDTRAAGRLCIEGGDFRHSPLDTGWARDVLCARVSPHQALAVIAAVVVVIVVRVRVERVGERAVLRGSDGIVGEQSS